VHTHDDRPFVYGVPAAKLAGVRTVIHTCHSQGVRLAGRQLILGRLAAAGVTRLVCVSEDSARLTAERGLCRDRLSVIRNGIDAETFAYTGPRPDGSAVVVARLSPEKDIATLLRATSLVAAEEPGFRLEVAGDGPCLGDLKALATELNLNERVTFLGLVSDVAAMLKQARLFVLPSLSEGVSLTILEAMARGLPVAATAVGGTPEVVHDGATGLLVEPARPDEMARALLRLWRDPRTGQAFGLAGRRRVEQDFDVRTMVRRYEELYLGGANS
jgi:glycosyltransferase involved in cell wall biosynthesis